MDPLAINLIRTYVPVLVGAVASFLVAHGLHVQPDQTAWAVAAMTGVFSSAYYTVVRVLETRWPVLGRLFLLSKPAVSLHVAEACPALAEDYGEGWPPPEDDAALARPLGRHVADAPESVPPMASLPPTAAQTQAPPSGNYIGAAHPDYRPGPLRVRKADTGAIPVYQRPPGR